MSPHEQEQRQVLLIQQFYLYCLQVLFARDIALFFLFFISSSVASGGTENLAEKSGTLEDDKDSSEGDIENRQVKDQGILGQFASNPKKALGKPEKFSKPLMGSLLGQEYDPENSLYYYNARYYDPSIGIFTTADTIIPDESDPLSYNRHMYVRGNPINYTDPSGHFFVSLLIAIGIATAVSAGVGYVEHGVRTGEWTGEGAARAALNGAGIGLAIAGSLAILGGVGLSFFGGIAAAAAVSSVMTVGGGSVSLGVCILGGPCNNVGAGVSQDIDWGGGTGGGRRPEESDPGNGGSDSDIVSNSDEPSTHLPAGFTEDDVTSGFGWRGDPFTDERKYHSGIDLRARRGRAVYATGAGSVITARDGCNGRGFSCNGGAGNYVRIRHQGGQITRYLHLSRVSVRVGKSFDPSQPIGSVGSTGRSTGPHLHFDVSDPKGIRRDPLKYKWSP